MEILGSKGERHTYEDQHSRHLELTLEVKRIGTLS